MIMTSVEFESRFLFKNDSFKKGFCPESTPRPGGVSSFTLPILKSSKITTLGKFTINSYAVGRDTLISLSNFIEKI